jgi:hypothetical protein
MNIATATILMTTRRSRFSMHLLLVATLLAGASAQNRPARARGIAGRHAMSGSFLLVIDDSCWPRWAATCLRTSSSAASARSIPGSYLVKEFTLHTNEGRTLNAKLEVGKTEAIVEVKASEVALDTQDATVGTVIQHQSVNELTLNGRDFTQLILLTPGAAPTVMASRPRSLLPAALW